MQRKLIRLALVAATAAGALALAGPALAAFTPKIDVSIPNQLGATGTTVIHLAVAQTDDAAAKITLYVPPGFTANIPAPGTQVGTIAGNVSVGDLAGQVAPITGTIGVRDASGTSLVGGVPVPLAVSSRACTGTATHTAFFVAAVTSAAGFPQALEVPIYVDQTTGADASIGAYKFTLCLPPADVPANNPNRAPLGAKFIEATLTFTNLLTNPTEVSLYLWHSVWTPYAPGTGEANVAGSVTALGINGVPVTLKLKGKYDKKKKRAKLSGQISVGGQFRAGAALPLFAGPKPKALKGAGSTSTTDFNGAFSAIRKIVRTTFFQIRIASTPLDFTDAGCPVAQKSLPKCVTATLGAFSVASNIVKVVVPKKR